MKGPYITIDGTSAATMIKAPAAVIIENHEPKQTRKEKKANGIKTLDKWFDMPGMSSFI
jgi:hypothetical protein